MLYPRLGQIGWDPLAEMRRLQSDMNRLFSDLEGRGPSRSFPPINLWIGEESVVVSAELPGVTKDEIDLTVREDTLTITGKRLPAVDGDKVAWHRRERDYGEFSRAIELPYRVDPDKVQARFNNGVLEVELQRPAADRPKKIQITAA
jgi:HSP20 family protein